MLATRPNHQARLLGTDPAGVAECFVCGLPVIRDLAGVVTHEGETARPVVIHAAADRAAVDAAVGVVVAALRTLPAAASDTDRARVIVDALYERGALRRRPGSRQPARRDLVLFH